MGVARPMASPGRLVWRRLGNPGTIRQGASSLGITTSMALLEPSSHPSTREPVSLRKKEDGGVARAGTGRPGIAHGLARPRRRRPSEGRRIGGGGGYASLGTAPGLASPGRPGGRRLGRGAARQGGRSVGIFPSLALRGPPEQPSTGESMRLWKKMREWRGRAMGVWVSRPQWPGPRRRRPPGVGGFDGGGGNNRMGITPGLASPGRLAWPRLGNPGAIRQGSQSLGIAGTVASPDRTGNLAQGSPCA